MLRCSVALESYITGTAGGRGAAQRYAERQESNVLHLHPLSLIETHSKRWLPHFLVTSVEVKPAEKELRSSDLLPLL